MWIKQHLFPFIAHHWLKFSLILLPWFIFFLLILPFHIPDEYSHYTYIQSLASGNYPYLQDITIENCWSEEVQFFEKQYLHNNFSIAYSPRTNLRPPQELSDAAHCSTQAQHPPLYYGTATVIYKIATFFGAYGHLRYNLTRLTSLLFFGVFLYFVHKLLSLFFPPSLSSKMMLLFPFQPMLLQLTTHVNPEIALITCSTATLYYICNFFQQKKISPANIVFLSFLSLLCFYSKITGIAMAPVVLLTIFFLFPHRWSERLKNSFLFLSIYITGITPYLLWNYHLYGKPLENGLMYLVNGTFFPPEISFTMRIFYLFTDYYQSFFQIAGDIARLDAQPFHEVRVIYSFTLLLFTLLGIWVSFTKNKNFLPQRKQRIVLLLHLVFTLCLYMYLGYDYMRLAWMGPLLQIRYTFMTILPVAIFFFSGLFTYLKLDKSRVINLLFLLSVFHFNTIVFWLIIPRFYL